MASESSRMKQKDLAHVLTSSQQLTLWEDNSNSRQSVTECMDQSWSYTSLLKNYILEGILAGFAISC
ncbi:hypothetical protein AAG906_033175 [Vitis piasezkii]